MGLCDYLPSQWSDIQRGGYFWRQEQVRQRFTVWDLAFGAALVHDGLGPESAEQGLAGRAESQGYKPVVQPQIPTMPGRYQRETQAGALHIEDVRIFFISTTKTICLSLPWNLCPSWSVLDFSSYDRELDSKTRKSAKVMINGNWASVWRTIGSGGVFGKLEGVSCPKGTAAPQTRQTLLWGKVNPGWRTLLIFKEKWEIWIFMWIFHIII